MIINGETEKREGVVFYEFMTEKEGTFRKGHSGRLRPYARGHF